MGYWGSIYAFAELFAYDAGNPFHLEPNHGLVQLLPKGQESRKASLQRRVPNLSHVISPAGMSWHGSIFNGRVLLLPQRIVPICAQPRGIPPFGNTGTDGCRRVFDIHNKEAPYFDHGYHNTRDCFCSLVICDAVLIRWRFVSKKPDVTALTTGYFMRLRNVFHALLMIERLVKLCA